MLRKPRVTDHQGWSMTEAPGWLDARMTRAKQCDGSLGLLLVDLKLDPKSGWQDEAATRRWLRETCVARWVCPDMDAIEIARTEKLVLGILNPCYPLDGARSERRGGSHGGQDYDQ